MVTLQLCPFKQCFGRLHVPLYVLATPRRYSSWKQEGSHVLCHKLVGWRIASTYQDLAINQKTQASSFLRKRFLVFCFCNLAIGSCL